MATDTQLKSSAGTVYTVPALLVGMIVIMIIPIPATLLDILLAFNITISLVVLFVALYLGRPLEFSAYPSIVLITTLFRLAMNITSTRLILLNGDQGLDAAGHVIQAFGNFVLGGNYVVGVVIFTIIVMINFTVITKGSGRIAEVAARFTLDAMPGKQMAIDSDLNSGLISEDEAKQLRKDLAREAEFYGAMDGASKFVRGDAMAGILITFVNILGGLFIGIVQAGMPWREAAETYTLLTVGDGLVSQIPALIISTSAGMIVARAASGADLGTEVTGQLTRFSQPLGLAAAVSIFFAFVPGLPFLPFLLLGICSGTLSLSATTAIKENEKSKKAAELKELPATPAPGSTEEVKALLGVDLLELEVGYELVPMVDASTGGDLIDRIRALRRQFAMELGFIVPPIHIRDNVRIQPSEYRLMLKGIQLASGTLKPHHYLAMDPGGVEAKIPGTPTKEPAFGLDALWISQADKERAQFAGYTVVDPATVVTTHITELIKRHANELLGRQEVQGLLDNLSKNAPKLVEEVIPNILPLGIVQQVLCNLLKEGVSIRDLRTILETLADWGPTTKSPERLTEHARRALRRNITARHAADNGSLTLISMTPSLERALADSLQVSEHGSYLALEPSIAQKLLAKLSAAAERFSQLGSSPVLLAPAQLRAALFSFTERFIPGFAVLSHQEIDSGVRITSAGVVSIDSGE
ncbi:MAG: flagellar biosynthesis protein FlhA [Deltaproteobacteria bacterium]|nr:flagellar biosynthesis protein FlhA [Deltaproteobacteria bacterium]